MKFITKNSSAQTKHALEHQATQEPLVITDCLQTQREDTSKDKCVWKRMVVDSRCRVDKKKKKKNRGISGFAVLGNSVGAGGKKCMHCGSNPSILVPADR